MKILTFPNTLSSPISKTHDNLSVDFILLGWHWHQLTANAMSEDKARCVSVAKVGPHTPTVLKLTAAELPFLHFFKLGSFFANTFGVCFFIFW